MESDHENSVDFHDLISSNDSGSISFDNENKEGREDFIEYRNFDAQGSLQVLELDLIMPLELLIYSDPLIFKYLRRTPLLHHRRPKMKNGSNQLQLFIKGEGCYPKIEYFRLFLIRLLKNLIKKIMSSRFKDFKIKLNSENAEQVKALDIIKEICFKYSDKMKEFSMCDNGPQTEGKTTRSTTFKTNPRHKSQLKKYMTYNNDCIYYIFGDPVVRGVYKAFIDYLFEARPSILIEKFGFRCCKLALDDCCVGKWKDLKVFSMSGLVLCELVNPT